MAENPDLTFEPVADDDLLVARMRASYRALPAPSAGQIERCTRDVLASVAAGATEVSVAGTPGTRGGAQRGGGLLLRPQWWWGVAAAATLVVTVMRPWRGAETQRNADSAFAAGAAAVLPVGSTRDEGGGEIRFDLTLPTTARAVAIVGDFNGWDETKTPMAKRGTDGTWSVRVPLSPGRYSYAFVVDGREWLVDARAPQVPDAGFGPANAVIVDGAE